MKSRHAAQRSSPVQVGISNHSHYIMSFILLILGSSQVRTTNGMTTVTCDGVPLCSNLKCRGVSQTHNNIETTINGNTTHDKSVEVKCQQVDMYIIYDYLFIVILLQSNFSHVVCDGQSSVISCVAQVRTQLLFTDFVSIDRRNWT